MSHILKVHGHLSKIENGESMNTHVLSFDPVIPDPAISPKLEDNFSDVYAWGYLLQRGEKGSTLTIGK